VQELGESIAGQIARLSSGNTPCHKCHAQFMNGVGQGTGSYWLFGFFSGSSNLFWALNQSSGGQKNCIVYSLFCIVVIIIVIIITISSIISTISFVALLNCLYLNPRVSPFVCFSSPSL